jgi:protein-S-isoprenylcysteine O-methyltransferase Ste14
MELPHDIAFHGIFLLVMVVLGMARVRFWRRQREVFGVQFVRRESLLVEIRQLAALIAFVLVGMHMFTPRLLQWAEVPVPVSLRSLAAVLALVLAPVVVVLARYSSKQLHPPSRITFVTTGPHHFVRHPLYASMIAIAVPLTLLAASWIVGLLAVALIANLVVRARREDAALSRACGAEYDEYARRTPDFVPRLRAESTME